jgi:hypothetical protein
MEMVEGGSAPKWHQFLSEKLLAELSGLVRDAGSTFSAPPFIHARPGEARPALLVDNAGRVDHGAGR